MKSQQIGLKLKNKKTVRTNLCQHFDYIDALVILKAGMKPAARRCLIATQRLSVSDFVGRCHEAAKCVACVSSAAMQGNQVNLMAKYKMGSKLSPLNKSILFNGTSYKLANTPVM